MFSNDYIVKSIQMIYRLVIHNDNKQINKQFNQFSYLIIYQQLFIYRIAILKLAIISCYNLVFFHFDQMKKLIINEKNLPKLNKPVDPNNKFRIKNSSNPIQGKKERQPSLQNEITEIIQRMQAHVFKNQPFSHQNAIKAINFLKCYKDSQSNLDPLLTQSLKFSKVRLKFSQQDKQNNSNKKVVSCSERQENLKQKSVHHGPIRKITLPYKKSLQKSQNKQPDSPIISWERERERGQFQFNIVNVQKVQKQTNTQQSQIQNCIQEQSLKKVEQEVDVEVKKDLEAKQRETQELNQRIIQLNSNIQSLLRKQSLKSQEIEKIYVEKSQLIEKVTQLQKSVLQLGQKNNELMKKITTSQQETKNKLQKEFCNQGELKLQKNNLKSENEVLLQRLRERESQLTVVWKIWQEKLQSQSQA